jgi:hypothetical protein
VAAYRAAFRELVGELRELAERATQLGDRAEGLADDPGVNR